MSSKLVHECLLKLNRLANLNTVKVLWVSGHNGIHGNELADELAKKGTTTPISWAQASSWHT